MSALILSEVALGGLPDAGPLDVTYSTLRQELSGSASRSTAFRSRLVFDGARIYHLKELEAPRPGIFADREYLFDGRLVYKANSLGVATVYEGGSIEGTDSALFWSDYADAIGYDLPNTRSEVGESVAWLDRGLACTSSTLLPDTCETRVTYEQEDVCRIWQYEIQDGQPVSLESEEWIGGKLARRSRSAGFFSVGSRLLPGLVHSEEFDTERIDGEPVAILDIVVENASSSAEALPRQPTLLKPGTLVGDARYGEAPTAQGGFLTYRFPVPVETLEKNWAACFEERAAGSSPTVLGALTGLFCSLLTALVRVRRARP